jgi:hypothetical protein
MRPSRVAIRSPRVSRLLSACLLLVLIASASTPALHAQDPLDGVW